MRIKLIDELSSKFNIAQKELIEKDIILHEILSHLSQSKYFSQNYVFKGGTCLVKTHLGYYRFSEDLDFTWINQKFFDDKSPSATAKYLSKESEKLGDIFVAIANKFSLDFKFEKSNERYFHFSSGGKMLTLYVWYNSEITNSDTMIKIQINFLEMLCYSPENKQMQSLAPGDEDLKFLFTNNPYFDELPFKTYSPKEILCEKIRAILTRQGIKARDFLDIYLICRNFSIDLSEVKDNAVTKLQYSLDMYERYRNNMAEKIQQLQSGTLFDWGGEQNLLLKDIDEDSFYSFNRKFEDFLRDSILNLSKDVFVQDTVAVCSDCLKKSYLPNPLKQRFDQVDLTTTACPHCKKAGTLQAFPF